MKYSEFLKVNENFQYSVNLQFDINNINKIKEYIPTIDGCGILDFFVNSILEGKNRSTTLIGPYGKGKSHLLLVLLTILNNYDKNEDKAINEFIKKIENVDSKLGNKLQEIRNNKIKLMPVIINSNYDDLNQAFLLSLSEALERENINGIMLNTYFDIALNVINEWEENNKDLIKELKVVLKNYNLNISELKKQLKKYSKEYYDIFKRVYKVISKGQEFSPLVNSDIVKIYKDINHEIANLGYKGMFIAFDEFSKFLESSSDNLMKDLKILQDFAELASRTKEDEQLHLCCITHKSINEYFKYFDESKANAFKTVEGRFKTIYFNSSIEQNYEIVTYAIKKEKGFKDFFEKFYNKSENFYKSIQSLDVFKNTNNIKKILFEGCFPLNPITVYALIELSEKIAQNERTLFTFITDDDYNSLKSFIKNSGDGLFNIDKVYDYFNILLKVENDSHIRSIYVKSQNALRKNISDDAKRLVKALAVIYMINNLDIFIPNDEILKLSCNLDDETYSKVLNELIDESIIRRKKIVETLDFATIYSREITNEIKELVEERFNNINEKDVLNTIIDKSYSLPRKYNDEYKMTRFFVNVFMSEEEVLNLVNFDILFENNYCDGIIINLLRTSKNVIKVIDKFQMINDDRVLLKVSKSMFNKNFINLLQEYEAINYMKREDNSSNEFLLEIGTIESEITEAIKEGIKEFFASDNIEEYVYLGSIRKDVLYESSILSEICEKIYNKTPIINNEMINKLELSAPIKKARDIVINTVLEHDITKIKSATSAEATIYRATVGKKEEDSVKQVLDIIKDFIKSNDSVKKSFKDIYIILENKPYAIRKGIIPILLAMALYDFTDNTILYYMNREIDINAENLVKLNDNPEKYFLQTEKGTKEKLEYITQLMNLYDVPKNTDILRANVKKVMDAMKKWVLSMPRIIRESNIENNIMNIDESYIKIKSELLRPDMNNNEFLFVDILDIFEVSDYSLAAGQFNKMKNTLDNLFNNYLIILIKETKEIFEKDFKGSISSLLREWYKNLSDNKKKQIYDLTTKNLLNYIKELNTHDENDILENLAKIITGYYVEDWQPDEKYNYIKTLKNIVLKIESSKEEINGNQKILLVNGDEVIEKSLTNNRELSALEKTMKNNIEEIIEEYGGALTEYETVNVLIDIIKKYL